MHWQIISMRCQYVHSKDIPRQEFWFERRHPKYIPIAYNEATDTVEIDFRLRDDKLQPYWRDVRKFIDDDHPRAGIVITIWKWSDEGSGTANVLLQSNFVKVATEYMAALCGYMARWTQLRIYAPLLDRILAVFYSKAPFRLPDPVKLETIALQDIIDTREGTRRNVSEFIRVLATGSRNFQELIIKDSGHLPVESSLGLFADSCIRLFSVLSAFPFRALKALRIDNEVGSSDIHRLLAQSKGLERCIFPKVTLPVPEDSWPTTTCSKLADLQLALDHQSLSPPCEECPLWSLLDKLVLPKLRKLVVAYEDGEDIDALGSLLRRSKCQLQDLRLLEMHITTRQLRAAMEDLDTVTALTVTPYRSLPSKKPLFREKITNALAEEHPDGGWLLPNLTKLSILDTSIHPSAGFADMVRRRHKNHSLGEICIITNADASFEGHKLSLLPEDYHGLEELSRKNKRLRWVITDYRRYLDI